MSFPRDRYTPFGYLDLPCHARRLSPLGVLRSEGIGFLWHFPAYARGYGGRRQHYVAGFRISLAGAFEIGDFDSIDCPYHSKNIVEFHARKGDVDAHATFHPIGDHALRCRLSLSGKGRARIGVHALYQRLIGATGEWGESGLVGRRDGDALILQGFESGEVFVLRTSPAPHDWGLTSDRDEARNWKDRAAPGTDGFVPVPGKMGDVVSLHATLGFEIELSDTPATIDVLMARGPTVERVQTQWLSARAQGDVEEARLRAEDDRFWARAPRLEGDWPDHCRRGLVYDLETARMMMKPPIGIYHHAWDAMQIQSPRAVLAEASMDALLLAYGDPLAAQQLMLGTFADAPEPNVPCSREDGTYNMVSADGTACGTAPSWGYPWLALASIAALRPDRDWLEQLYPRLAAYLDWWLMHRRDAGGWLVYACSWESGQDNSPRFGDQPLGGGHPTWHVRPADLQAAFAHAVRTMQGFAEALGHEHDAGKWRALAEEFHERTDRLWNGSRYADFDTHAGGLTAVDDVMLLAPIALGVAQPERVAAMRATIEAINPDDLTWPMLAWTATEAALNAGLYDKAARLAWAVCERVYRFWDAREYNPERTLPGVACEYWPLNGRCGGEGYGWGAFTTHLVLRVLVGLSLTGSGITLHPNLPLDWRVPGRRYVLRMTIRNAPLVIVLEPVDTRLVQVTINDETVTATSVAKDW
jgi:hypothetical protein